MLNARLDSAAGSEGIETSVIPGDEAAPASSRTIQSFASNWRALPTYGTRSLAPLAMLWLSGWQICLLLAVCSLVWYPLCKHFVNLHLAVIFSVLNNLLICVAANAIVAAGLFLAGAFREGLLALIWPIIAAVLARLLPQPGANEIESKLWKQWRKTSTNE